MGFLVHPKLAADTVFLTDWGLSRALLMNDRRFPWLILVPRRLDVSEIFDLPEMDRAVMIGEIARAGEKLKAWARLRSSCNKINIGSLGNVVPQLHIHVVARSEDDAAWPGPVWGAGQPEPYGTDELTRITAELRDVL